MGGKVFEAAVGVNVHGGGATFLCLEGKTRVYGWQEGRTADQGAAVVQEPIS